MESKLPVLQLGKDLYHIDLARGVLSPTVSGTKQIVLSDLPLLQPENKYLIFYREGHGVVGQEQLAMGLPPGTKCYRFPGPSELDPIAYAQQSGQGVKGNSLSDGGVIKAERLRLPTVYFEPTQGPVQTMREFFSRMIRWKRNTLDELRQGRRM